MTIHGFACIVTAVFMSTAAVGQTGQGSGGTSGSPARASGGSLGTSAGAPGTNSAGTATPSDQTTGLGNRSAPALGTGNPEVDKEDKLVGQKIKGICKGC
jgi:hypothetical protein